MNAFDHKSYAERTEALALPLFKSGGFESALELFVVARDSYIVWGSSQSMQRCQRYIQRCLVRLGRLDSACLEFLQED